MNPSRLFAAAARVALAGLRAIAAVPLEQRPKFPNQWHLEAGITEPRAALGMITVLMPHRQGIATGWEAQRSDAAGRPAVEITVADRKHRIQPPAPGTETSVAVRMPWHLGITC